MRLGILWTLAALAGVIGATLMFDALPGINWGIWTVVTIGGLLIYLRPDRQTLRTIALPLGFAVLLATGAAVTTAPLLLAVTVAMVASLMALGLLLANEHEASRDYGPVDILTAPIRGLVATVRGAISSLFMTAESLGSVRKRPALRGALIATPVVLVLALLFATADPVLGAGRDAIYNVLSSWTDLPRVIFGLLLTLFVSGAYVTTRAASLMASRRELAPGESLKIGLTERRIVLTSAAIVCWLFVLLQLSYLFGASPAVAGSGVTFAEYAHRGFGELTFAATLAALLIIAAQSNVRAGRDAGVRASVTWPALILLAAVACILVSAFHRMTLYEDAYGFTTVRVYVQAYILLALAVLLALAWHVWHVFDVRALARQVMTVSLATLALLIFWNCDAWVAQANVDRYTHTGKLDVHYLTHELSLDAYPSLVQAIPRVAEPERSQLSSSLAQEHARHSRGSAWYEWNLRRERARSFVVISRPSNPPRPL